MFRKRDSQPCRHAAGKTLTGRQVLLPMFVRRRVLEARRDRVESLFLPARHGFFPG